MNRLEFKTSRKITDHYRGVYGVHLKIIKKNWKITTCDRLDLATLGIWPIVPKNLPDTRTPRCIGICVFKNCFVSLEDGFYPQLIRTSFEFNGCGVHYNLHILASKCFVFHQLILLLYFTLLHLTLRVDFVTSSTLPFIFLDTGNKSFICTIIAL